jgi:hypothetical protein
VNLFRQIHANAKEHVLSVAHVVTILSTYGSVFYRPKAALHLLGGETTHVKTIIAYLGLSEKNEIPQNVDFNRQTHFLGGDVTGKQTHLRLFTM